jgi:hypothetical protein
VLDHDPGAPVAFSGEYQIPVPPWGAALPISPEEPLERRRPPRDRLAPIEGSRPKPRPHGVFVPGLIYA